MHRIVALPLAVIASTLLVACSEDNPTSPRSRATSVGRASADVAPSGIWADQVEGVTANGAPYALFKPANWNGDVVFYAHGIIDPALPVALPTGDDFVPTRNALGERGFAVAYSGWSENGYDFKDGLQRTHQLRGLFTSRYGKPTRSFLLGHSLGSQIVEALAETYPDQYDGALALCGVVGGTRRQVNYIGNIRTVFDVMYPNWLPGTTTMDVPVIPSQGQVVGAALTAMNGDGFGGFGRLSVIDQSKLAGRNANEMINTLLTVLVYHGRGVNDFLGRTHGHFLFDNALTAYSSSVLPSAYMGVVNNNIARYTSTADAEAWLDNNYEPTGQLRIPMLTLHNRFDPLVPFAHETAYQVATSNVGSANNLRQRTRNEYGHCNFGTDLTVSTFQDLVGWVTTGVPAAP